MSSYLLISAVPVREFQDHAGSHEVGSLPPRFCSSCLGSQGTSQKSQSRVRCTAGWCRHMADQRHKFLNGFKFC
jgi:hypothetical protein